MKFFCGKSIPRPPLESDEPLGTSMSLKFAAFEEELSKMAKVAEKSKCGSIIDSRLILSLDLLDYVEKRDNSKRTNRIQALVKKTSETTASSTAKV